MDNVDLLRFKDETELATAAVAAWFESLKKAPPGARFCTALSGGRIAGRFFNVAAQMGRNQPSLLGAVHFFWGDERCVSPEDPESNFKSAHELLLRPLSIAPERIHRIRGEENPGVAARQAEEELRQYAPLSDAAQPVLDLIFLGMGEEGHVASLFPGEPDEVMSSPAVYRPVIASKPPPQRITLGYKAIAAAREVWVLASGAGKSGALRESLLASGRTPLARVLRSRSSTRIFTDIS